MNSQSLTTVIKIGNIIKSLKKLPENEYESDQCLEYLKKIDNSFNDEKALRAEIAKAMVDHQYPEIALKCLKFYTRKNLFENDQTWPCCFYLLRSIWNYSDINPELAIACSGFIPILLEFLTNECLLSSDEEDEKLYKLSLNIMNNIAHQPETKVYFQQNQASKILKNVTHSIESEHLKVLVYLILAQIINENEFDKLNDPSNEVAESVVNYIKESLKKERRYKGISTSEYLECLAKLAVTKDNKIKIYETGVLSVLKQILGNSAFGEEQNHALTCLWNLSYEEKICDILKRDKEFNQTLCNIRNMSPSEEMQKKAAGILFTLNDLGKKVDSKIQLKNNHVMISYNWASRDVCLKIKDDLKSRGYQVWIDVEQIYGSTLASMAEAVENSSVFLMCVSEKYYQSPNCRLEAEYAVKLQKPIIPLVMQQDYSPHGWLGIIIGGKIYYKFAGQRVNFDQTMSSVIKEVNRYYQEEKPKSRLSNLNSTNSSNQSNNLSSSNTYNNNLNGSNMTLDYQRKIGSFSMKQSTESLNASEWTTKDVKNWLNSLNLSTWIVDSDIFDNVNGMLLKELYEIKRSSPDFFYSTLKSKFTNNSSTIKHKSNGTYSVDDFNLSDLLKLSYELSELFSSQKS
ncbi:unnamed protein product [Brachionus calyciflorus]|uniref:TIR domain-containing protein n=1 Tax=Brachionus calyciflorus TaxID=104777 RepID=A0A813RTC5_9BILA|nr:unnamed protein product [Brachionus calyciflorus]